MALRPVIAICGSTGVGKSRLAVELALKMSNKFDYHGWKDGVVVNADPMQVFKGFDVLTNKIPLADRAGVDHVLMDFKEPTEQYVVSQWIHDATRVISDAHSSGKVPIIVGGTTYWIQQLVLPGRLPFESEQAACPGLSPSAGRETYSDGLSSALSRVRADSRELFDALPQVPPSVADDPSTALALHNLLKALDPLSAARWDWRDAKKVLRELTIMKERGRKASEIQRERSTVSLRPRYDTLCLWLYAEPTVLKRRLYIRTEEMLQDGVLDDLRQLARLALSSNTDVASISTNDACFGVLQSIGLREFYQYLTDPSPSESMYQAAIQNLKAANHQYAKRQASWIRNKFLPAIRTSMSTEGTRGIGMYLLDTTEPRKWTSEVKDIASGLMEAFLRRDPLPDPLTLSSVAQKMLSVPVKTTECAVGERLSE
ncbi:IPP transferase-domain-containing protein [Russula compacta]|nr:IPP transferase-domain-containing protein [Russula compacta]